MWWRLRGGALASSTADLTEPTLAIACWSVSEPMLCSRIWPLRSGTAHALGEIARLLEAREAAGDAVTILIGTVRFSDSGGPTRFSDWACVTRFSGFEIAIRAHCFSLHFGAWEFRCGLRSLEMHGRAVDGATLMRLRSASAGGPLRARPLLHSLSALVTKGSISLGPSETEIGKLTRVEL